MPPVVSSLALGCGLAFASFGLVMLLVLLTMHPRAKPTLIWCNRPWNVRPVVLTIWLASGLLLLVPRMDWPVGPPRDRAADDPKHNPADREASGLDTEPSGAVDPSVIQVPPLPPADRHGASSAPGDPPVAITPPEGREQQTGPHASPPEPVNLTGEWTILNTILETSYPPFQRLRLGFRVTVQQDGQAFHGVGEKQRENGRLISVSARRPLRLQGTIADGGVISATFQEEGASRTSTGHFRLRLQDRGRLTGTFVSTAARAKGSSQWTRQSSQVAHASRGDQPGRNERLVPPAEPWPDVGPLPALTEEPRPAPELNGPGTTQGLRVARQRGADVAGRADEPREPARPVAPAGQRPPHQRRPELELGMTPAEVRDLLGEPTSVEAIAGFVFWHYGTDEHEQAVVFEQGTDRVHGWLGFSRGLTAGPGE
jgi:hypothetical protein